MFGRKKATESTGVVSALLEIIFGLLLGVVIAAVWLIFKPVTIADAIPKPEKDPKPPERHSVLYITGRPGSQRSPQSIAKERALFTRTPGEITLAEEDANRWIGATYRDLDLSRKWESYSFEVRPVLPAVRLVGSEIEIGMVFETVFMESKRKFVVQARGVFEDRDGVEVFVPRKMYLGSCPLPAGQARWLYNSIAGKFVVPDDMKVAWAAVESARVEQDRLKLAIKAAPGI